MFEVKHAQHYWNQILKKLFIVFRQNLRKTTDLVPIERLRAVQKYLQLQKGGIAFEKNYWTSFGVS